MRRSEAIKILKELILQHMNCAPECCSSDENMYSTIMLEIQSKIGMQPPLITVMPNSYNRSEGNYGYEVNEWEGE